MSPHRIALPGVTLAEHEPLIVEGEEAHHARRVMRLDVGAAVELLDCVGGIARCRVLRCEKLSKRDGWRMEVVPERIERVSPLAPRVEVLSEPPKGNDLERMIDQLSQLGVARWSPLGCHRSEVEPRSNKMDRLRRTAIEASKQCGRVWAMEIGERTEFADALRSDEGTQIVVCHMTGEPLGAPTSERIRLLVGPVGDLTEDELAQARDAGATIATFGPLTMRIDTACCAAGAIVMASAMSRARGG